MATTQTMEERMDTMMESVGNLASVVLTLAKREKTLRKQVFKEDMEDEEEYEVMDKMPMEEEEDEMGMMKEHEEPDGDEGYMPEDEMDMKMSKTKVAKRKAVKREARKGFANTASKGVDEEDGPFDEQQNNIKGNEPSPAGRMEGGREDETFNVSFTKVMNDVAAMRKAMEASGIQVAKSIVPHAGSTDKGRGRGAEGEVMTRQMQEDFKKLPYKAINEYRMQVGDLNRNFFG